MLVCVGPLGKARLILSEPSPKGIFSRGLFWGATEYLDPTFGGLRSRSSMKHLG